MFEPNPPSTAHSDPSASPSSPLGGAVGLHEIAVPLVSDQHTGLQITPHNAWPLCDTT